jgi:copper chaperone
MKNEKLVLNVKGMSCQHCVNSIKKAVGGIKGIEDVEVDLEKNTVTISYDPDTVNIKDVTEAIEDEGYEVE